MTEQEAVATAAERYRADGYAVTLNPNPAGLPPPLDRRRPAILATRNGTSVILEVWARDRLNELPPAELPKGWEFEIISLPLPADAPGPGPEATPDYAQRLLAELDEFIPRGATHARFLMAWSAAESAMRVAAARIGLDPVGVSAGQLMSELAFNGLIGHEEYGRLRDYMFARNRLIHGVPAEGLEPRQADDLAGIARALLAEAPVAAA